MNYYEFDVLNHVDKTLAGAYSTLKILARDLNNQELAEAVKHIDVAYEKVGKVLVEANIDFEQ